MKHQFDDMNFPRPSVRHDAAWYSLNGQWEFEFDPDGLGLREHYQNKDKLTGSICVPFCYQSLRSGVGSNHVCDHVWYARWFDLPRSFNSNEKAYLHFGAVDYCCQVWLNGTFLGSHKGGFVPFRFDISAAVKPSANRLVIHVEDTLRKDQVRGKQYYLPKPESVFYERTTGIWQDVWFEILPASHIDNVVVTPLFEQNAFEVKTIGRGIAPGQEIEGRILDPNQRVAAQFGGTMEKYQHESIVKIPKAKYWTPQEPYLYTVEVSFPGGDCVRTRCGLREVRVEGREVFLNAEPLFQRLVLDQGYWPQTLMTPPDSLALKRDIELAKQMGFNGCRKHQKIEDPRFMEWADQLGFLVWMEMPSPFEYSFEMEQCFQHEMQDAMLRDYNHPSLIAYVPFNESWGLLPAGSLHTFGFMQRTVAKLRRLDSTRLVIDNDGWMHADTDLLTVHEYTDNPEVMKQLLKEFTKGQFALWKTCGPEKEVTVMHAGQPYRGQPLFISECGGLGFSLPGADDDPAQAWGYHGLIASGEEFLDKLRGILNCLQPGSGIAGFCYTQLTDVQQEVNGLLSPERIPKLAPALVCEAVMPEEQVIQATQ